MSLQLPQIPGESTSLRVFLLLHALLKKKKKESVYLDPQLGCTDPFPSFPQSWEVSRASLGLEEDGHTRLLLHGIRVILGVPFLPLLHWQARA